MSRKVKSNKVKLPRKRKKAFIKDLGRQNYLGMVVFNQTDEDKRFDKKHRMIIDDDGMLNFIPVEFY